jgi:hypothetical protein
MKAINQRDHEFLRLTHLVDQFLKERPSHDLGIVQKCLLPGFVMWLKDNGLLTFKEKGQ